MKLFNAIVIAFALVMVTAPANAGTNLILNGSFEIPDEIPPGRPGPLPGWEIFYAPTTGLEWIPILPGGMEIQDHVVANDGQVWNAYDGDQLAEMDTLPPPYGNGGMYQTVNTVSGQRYKLSFAYSPRPYLAYASSGIVIYINDVLVDTIWTNGVGVTNTVWSIANYTFTATGTSSTIKFMATGTSDGAGTLIDDVKLFPITELSCEGFETPMNNGPVKVRKNKGGRELPPDAPSTLVLPLKAELSDSDGFITDADIAARPVLQVRFDSGGGVANDVTADALPAGVVTKGNQFAFTNDGKWGFNLGTWNYTAPGTYTISVASGDETEYLINPTCTATFVVE